MPVFRFDGPDGPEQYEVPLGPNGLMRWHLAEARHIERVAGLSVKEFQSQIFDLNATALTALVQVLWKRAGRTVKFDDVDLDLSTFDVDLLPDEVEQAEPEEGTDPDPTSPPTSSGDVIGEG